MPRPKSLLRRYADGDRLRSLIRAGADGRGITMADAARQAGIDPAQLSKFLRVTKGIAKTKLTALASVLKVPVDDLLSAAGYAGTQANEFAPALKGVLISESFQGRKLRVVSDARFFDSCLFLWLFYTQPFREVGIECELDFADWQNVPLRVATRDWSIGFYNRAASETPGVPDFGVNYWADLAVYRGYSLLVSKKHDTKGYDVKTLKGAVDFLKHLRKAAGPRPTIVTVGADMTWRLRNNALIGSALAGFEFELVPDADVALEQFLAGFGDLFVGGLPQRLAATKAKCVEVLSFDNNPLLFSLNSLIYSGDKKDQPPPAVLAAATSLWYQTIARAKAEPPYRAELVEQCIRMATAERAQWLDADHFRALFDPDNKNPSEVLPARPTELADSITADVFVNILRVIKEDRKGINVDTVITDLVRTLGDRRRS